MAKKHVFLLYCHGNRADVASLRDDLERAGETVWWDQDILPGQDWKQELRRAMKDSYAVVMCLSREAQARTTLGIYPEALDAISVFREYAPGSIFLIPVRLSECEIPFIEIDATRSLDRLHYVDLFPVANRPAAMQKLLQAIRASPSRP